MKGLNEIIESGKLELYLLGELSASEEAALEKFLETSSEGREHLRALEDALEKVSSENAITPPSFVKESLLASLSEETKVVSISEKKSFNPLLGVAASLALLFGVSSFWLYTKVTELESQVTRIENENGSLQNSLIIVESDLAEVTNWYELITNPSTEKYILKGNANSPNAVAISYVNHNEKLVTLDAKGLPALPDQHDYQMWADVDGVMIDMGIIPKNSEMIAMQYIENAASLNITVEPAGGNDHPTVERLVTNIYLEP